MAPFRSGAGTARGPTRSSGAPDAPIIAGLFYAGIPVDELERGAGLVISGDRDLALRFADIFALPEKLV